MPESARILIVDDEPFNIDLLEQELEDQGYQTCAARSGEEALARVAEYQPDLVLLDWMMPGMAGIEVLRRLRAEPQWRALPVIMVTARASTRDKVAGLDAGADDYLTKPIDDAELGARIRAMLRIARLEQENLTLRRAVQSQVQFKGVIGRSRAMEAVYQLLRKVVDSDTTVLLSGETGTGKEVLARCIHQEGPRRDKPFVAVNCGAMAEQLLESELFGHKKGAFTGAVNDRPGLFETADGGTLFLDEIGETTPGLQVRLLRAVQEGEIRRVGEEQVRHVDVRVLAATHRDLKQAVAEGAFREDLYYRLNVFPIGLPPLRQRREDIPELALHFLGQLRQRAPRAPEGFTARAMDALGAYEWPGNIRELQNEVERAALLGAGEARIDLGHLSERLVGGVPPAPRRGKLKEVLAQVERELILQALERHQGNRTHAAEELGMSRWGLVQKVRDYGLEV
ncbi:MAG: sigma-54-dependent Fis family transcriptional regulator [Candidatus Latescibacteria bacterium]|nr:sigma-54-dependent Fis family transcriptional regulator [Candidatus Latescibacterota bacterium]